MAGRLGASALAIDTEELPLAMLREAFEAQQAAGRVPAAAALEARVGDAREAPLQDADVIVVSDLLYNAELARTVGERIGQAARRGQHVVVTCGGRSGRAAFVEAFSEAVGSPGFFEDTPVPAWAPERRDLFDGGATSAVGVLRY
ncbi:unnamed protein product [Prorocentrum cordatum]|uniref:Calmodulin-lysine N-methyltransferase n=1 Tax=Prorocentrum cordatum TaxID=2364126 RepID=A0ABN9QY74_9DINO|nr:unnamed protein product [Polarella glacialis]